VEVKCFLDVSFFLGLGIKKFNRLNFTVRSGSGPESDQQKMIAINELFGPDNFFLLLGITLSDTLRLTALENADFLSKTTGGFFSHYSEDFSRIIRKFLSRSRRIFFTSTQRFLFSNFETSLFRMQINRQFFIVNL
jgi:hypothetical protein